MLKLAKKRHYTLDKRVVLVYNAPNQFTTPEGEKMIVTLRSIPFLVDMRNDIPSFLLDQEVVKCKVRWYQVTHGGEEPPTWLIVAESIVALSAIFALAFLCTFL